MTVHGGVHNGTEVSLTRCTESCLHVCGALIRMFALFRSYKTVNDQ